MAIEDNQLPNSSRLAVAQHLGEYLLVVGVRGVLLVVRTPLSHLLVRSLERLAGSEIDVGIAARKETLPMNWRDLGDIDRATFTKLLTDTPLASDADAIYDAVKGYSLIYYAHLVVESSVGTSILSRTNHNPTGLRPRGGDGFMFFNSFPDAAKEWKARVTDPNYAYAPTKTLEQYIHTYAPSSDGNNEGEYVASIKSVYDKYGGNTVTEVQPEVTFGNVPYPEHLESELSLDNPWVQPHALPVPMAVFWHRMVGTFRGTDGWFHGGHAATAYGIAVKAVDAPEDVGKIFEWISPESGNYGESSGPAEGP